MGAELVYDYEQVLFFMKQHLPGFARVEGATAIGLARGGQLVAGVVFEGFNGKNVWMHVAAVPGSHWLNRKYLRAAFLYPFVIAGVERISGYVEASNERARAFDEHLGFREETRLKGAAQDGGDVILYCMRRGDCRYVPLPPN